MEEGVEEGMKEGIEEKNGDGEGVGLKGFDSDVAMKQRKETTRNAVSLISGFKVLYTH
jgi:hypothetical protein